LGRIWGLGSWGNRKNTRNNKSPQTSTNRHYTGYLLTKKYRRRKMGIFNFKDYREQFIEEIRNNEITPIIGSGFTRACNAKNGIVPSGKEYRNYMIKKIFEEQPNLSEKEKTDLNNTSFSEVANCYENIIPAKNQRDYIRDNFTEVELNDIQKEFLTNDFLYLYTLNIDDSIEKNSQYNYPILPNRKLIPEIFTDKKCVIKLHGDANDIISYTDSVCIFTTAQYVKSLKDNFELIKKLENDLNNNLVIYIGCSLADEIDLLSVSNNNDKNGINRYYCAVEEPDFLVKVKLEKNFGISHIFLF
jgi:hypothetical protein